MAITAEMVKNLRERTGAGMMECKTALTESNGAIFAQTVKLTGSGWSFTGTGPNSGFAGQLTE